MNASVLKIGSVLRSRKGMYDYLVTLVDGSKAKVLWIGPEIPGYRYTRIVKTAEIEKAYQVIQTAKDAGYVPDAAAKTGWSVVGEKKEWQGKETYLAHRKAIETEVKK